MTEKQMITELLELAHERGFDLYNIARHHIAENWKVVDWVPYINDILFDQSFASKVFGIEVVCADCGSLWQLPSHCCPNMDNEARSLRRWAFFLREMVLLPSDERVAFAYKYKKDKE